MEVRQWACRVPIAQQAVAPEEYTMTRPASSVPLIALALALCCHCALAAAAPQLKRTSRYARDHLIVKYKTRAPQKAVLALQGRIHGRPLRTFRSSGAVLLKLAPGQDVDKAIIAVRADPNVLYAELDHYLTIHRTIPNDPDFESSWGLDNQGQMLGTLDCDIDAPEAWDITTGSADVIIGIVDTGVDYDHPDLQGNMWTNAAELNGLPGEDDDGNGIVDDIYGIRVINGAVTGDPYDDHGHGTHCAGVVGATGNDYRGICGVNWNVSIMALKFLDAGGSGLESDAAACIEYAVDHGAKVLSNSYGGPDWSQALYDAIVYARNNGVLFCASAGNDTTDNDVMPSYPASYDLTNIIAVTSTGGSDNISYFSNYGATSVDVGAPGEAIWSTWPGNQYQLLDGTSMACPHVSGIAALVLSHDSGLDLDDLRDRVMWTGDRAFDLQDITVTGLRVNAYNAIMGIYSVRISTPSPLPDGQVGTPYSCTFAATGFAEPYTWSWSAPDYIERETANYFTTGGTPQGWQHDNAMWYLDLPFDFPFYGGAYSHVYVCSNGYIEFADTMPIPEDIPDMQIFSQKKVVAAYWSDLNTDYAGSLDIYLRYPDADTIDIRWKAQEADWLLGMPINVAITLHADGRVELHYGPENLSLVGGIMGVSNGDETNYRISTKKTGKLMLGWAPTSLFAPGALPPGLDIVETTGEVAGTPTEAGDYALDVTVEDGSGGSDTRPYELKVFPAAGPRADFEGDPLRGENPLSVTYTDLSTSSHPSGITSWSWNFGDGTSSALQNPVKQYSLSGIYTVSLSVTDADGADNMTRLRYVEVFLAGPHVDFIAEPQTGDAPLTVTFTDLTEPLPGNDRDILLWQWDFGDGEGDIRLDGYPFTHTYSDPGVYDVTLEAMDWSGGTGIEKKYAYIVAVDPNPTATLTWSVSPPAGGTVTAVPPDVTAAAGAETYAQDTIVNLTANPQPAYRFDHWVGGVANPNDPDTTITMDGNKTVEAVFVLTHTLSVNATPVASVPIAADPAEAGGTTDYQAQLDDGTAVVLTAPEKVVDGNATYGLVQWVVGGVAQPQGQTTITVQMTANVTAVAEYALSTRLYVSQLATLIQATGEQFDIKIKLRDAPAFNQVAFSLGFAPSVVQVVAGPTQAPAVAQYAGAMPTAAELNTLGTGDFAFVLPGGQTASLGSLDVVTLTFQFVGEWTDLPVTIALTDTLLKDTTDADVLHNTGDGVVEAGEHGNFDGDEDIDFWDFMNFIPTYGKSEQDVTWDDDCPIGDFDENCSVDFWDFMSFVAIYGT